MRPLPAVNLHVTLHFLGTVAADRRAAVRALPGNLSGAAVTTRIIELSGFPKPARARVLVARLEDPDGQLGRWHEILARLWPTGETRRFDPHVTLARSRSPVRLPGVKTPRDLALTLQAPAAYVSETLPEGARYQRLP